MRANPQIATASLQPANDWAVCDRQVAGEVAHVVAVDVNLDGVGVVLVRRLRDERRDVLSSDRPVSTDATGDRCDLGLSICLAHDLDRCIFPFGLDEDGIDFWPALVGRGAEEATQETHPRIARRRVAGRLVAAYTSPAINGSNLPMLDRPFSYDGLDDELPCLGTATRQ